MACGSRKPAPNQIVQINAPIMARASKVAKIAKPVAIDHHCEVCGYVGKQRRHTCPGGKPIAYQFDRLSKCNVCSYREGRICTLYKSKHPDRDCDIDVGVMIPEAYCPAGMWERVLYKCDKCKAVTFNENGLSSCPKCGDGKKACTMPWRFTAKDEPLPASRPLAIITIAAGQKALDVLELTRPSMERYAERVGADFHVVTDNKEPRYAIGNKFRLKSLAQNYERVLFLDSDVWIRNVADNLFDYVNPLTIGIHLDWTHLPDRKFVKWEGEQTAKEQHVEPKKIRTLNTGVVVFSHEHLDMWTPPPLPASPRHLSEQVWVEYNMLTLGYPITYLDTKHNTQFWFPDFKEREPDAQIIHLANCPHEDRIYRLKKYAWGDTN
jgi:rRNA maturation protein Nop10